MYCDPPVGLFVPVDYGYQRFYDLVKGARPYCAFAKLLDEYGGVFRHWFSWAGTTPLGMVVHVAEAAPLWDTFPTSANEGDTLRAVEVDSFLFWRMRLLWRYYCDAVACGPGTDEDDEWNRSQFIKYLRKLDHHLPTLLGWDTLSGTDYPFVAQLYQCTSSAEVTEWLNVFDLGHDYPLKAPKAVRSMEVVDFPDVESDEEDSFPPSSPPPKSISTVRSTASSRVDRRNVPALPQSPYFTQPSPVARRQQVTDDRYGSVSMFASRHITQEEGSVCLRRSPRNHRVGSQPRAVPPSTTSAKRHLQYDQGQLSGGRTVQRPRMTRSPSASSGPVAARYPVGHSAQHPRSMLQGPIGQPVSDARNITPRRPVIAGSFRPASTQRQSCSWHKSTASSYAVALVKPDSLMDATLQQQEKWKSCPSVWLHMTLLQLYPVPATAYLSNAFTGNLCVNAHYAFASEPTEFARSRVLACMETNTGVDVGSVRTLLAMRCSHGQEFAAGREFHYTDFVGLTMPLLKAIFNISTWQISRVGIVSAEDTRFHVLDFARILDPTLPKTHLPQDGYSLSQAQDVARVAYYLLALIGVDCTQQGELVDAQFGQSVFGEALWRLCRAPFNHQLAELWPKHQRHVTNVWINDFVALFEAVANFVNIRTGTGPANAIVFLETDTIDGGPFLGTSVVLPQRRGDHPDTLLTRIGDLSREFRRWHERHYHGREPMWQMPVSEALLAPAPPVRKPEPKVKKPRDKETQSGTKTPFTAQKPMFIFKQECHTGKTPQETMQAEKVFGWIKLDQPTGDGKRQVCFRCAFESCRTCPDMKTCKSRRNGRSRGGQRLHVDLADPVWKDYPKASWQPLVEFQRRNSKYFVPTEEFKKLVPGLDWKLD